MNAVEFEIGGKTRGFKFGLKFLSDILGHYDVDMGGLGVLMDKNPFAVRPTILYLGHKSYVQSKSMPVTFTEDEVIQWIEDLDNGISNENVIYCVTLVIEAVRSHLPKMEEVANENKDEKKN